MIKLPSHGIEKTFIDACGTGNLSVVQQLYREHPKIDLKAVDDRAILTASMYGCMDIVLQLIEWDSTVDIVGGFIFACGYGHLALARQLHDMFPDIHTRDKDNMAFILACESGYLDIVQQLYKWNPNMEIREDGDTAFIKACENGNLDIVLQLYEWCPEIMDKENADLYGSHDGYKEAFRVACQNGCIDVVQQLVEWDPDVGKNPWGFSDACLNNQVEVALWLQSIYPEIYVVHKMSCEKIISYNPNKDDTYWGSDSEDEEKN